MPEAVFDLVREEACYLAGQVAPPGRYRDWDTRREVALTHTGPLPASLDGRVACYGRVAEKESPLQMEIHTRP